MYRFLYIFILNLFLLPVLTSKAVNIDFVVALDGSGNFTSVQKAIDACKAFPDSRIIIFVKNGVYKEKIHVPSCNNKLSIIGESVENTIITFDDYFDKINHGRNSTFYTSTMQVLADDFYMENLTVENTAGQVGQAVALHIEGDRCVIRNCRFLGNQDTVYAAGRHSRQYFANCYISGTTDFIFGEATAFFEKCTIHCKSDSYITAASTTEGKPYGFVFQNCKIEAASPVQKVYLGRPWRSFAKVVFLSCELGGFIAPEGWDNWSNPANEKTVFLAELNNSGAGAANENRVARTVNFAGKDAGNYTKKRVLAPFGFEFPPVDEWYNLDLNI